jgi:hypothetical protein
LALIFLVLNYSMGFAFVALPGYYLSELDYHSFNPICPQSLNDRKTYWVFEKTIWTVSICCIGFLVAFKLLQVAFGGNDSAEMWLHTKSLNGYFLATVFSLTTLAQYPFTLVIAMVGFI